MGNHNTFCLWNLTACLVLVVSACIGCGRLPAKGGPSIQFTRIPPVNPGGPITMGSIAGRVNGPLQGLRVVLYAKSGRWYVQPYADQPFTAIKSDSTWGSPTHLGSDYAALLVQPDYVPPSMIDNLPVVGGGIAAVSVTVGTPPLWQRVWFRLLAVLLAASAVVAFYRWRMQSMARQLNLRFEERLAERTRIAQELHDTLLQSLFSISMQLHVAMDQLPDDSPARKTLNRAMQLMGPVIEDGRNTIRGLRSSIQNPDDLMSSFAQIPRELNAKGANFHAVVEGTPVPLRPTIRDEVYRIGREALTNAFRHSNANTIQLQLEYTTNHLRILVADDGCGISSRVLKFGRDGHWGLLGMRERATKIAGKLRVMSRPGGGTEIELRVPSHVAFESAPSRTTFSLFTNFHGRHKDNESARK
jgi:signal transduction histidine kinase